jgi:hypothetical protein
MTYSSDNFTWGVELELGDIPRHLNPPHCTWSLFETDIVNTLPPYYGIAADPKGINPPVGGELNTFPTKTIDKQIEYITNIFDFFKKEGVVPTTSCVSHTHIHVHIPNIKNNLDDLKKLLIFIYKNQNDIIEKTSSFDITPDMSLSTIDYLKNDSCRKYSKERLIEILSSTNLSDFFKQINLQRSKYNIGRYFINFTNLTTLESIEFRCFRATTDINHIKNIMLFIKNLLESAFNNISINYNFDFPKLKYDYELFVSWEKTKYLPIMTRNR